MEESEQLMSAQVLLDQTRAWLVWKQKAQVRDPKTGRYLGAGGGGASAALPPMHSSSNSLEASMKSSHTLAAGTQNPDIVYESNRTTGDKFLGMIQHEQGFAGKPQLASSAQLDAAIAKGGLEVFRGENDAAHAHQFMKGDLYTGTGIFGSGTYAAYGKDSGSTAKAYAQGSGACMRMVLPASARTITLKELTAISTREEALYGQKVRDAAARAETTGHWDEANKYNTLHQTATDRGRLAAALGYDAVLIEHMNYVVLLNRSKVLMQEGFYA